MNVGIVTTWFARGAGYVSRQLVEALSPQHNVLVYCRGGEKTGRGDPAWDAEYVTWGARPSIDETSAVDLHDFDNWLRRHRLDLVLFVEQRNWLPVLLCEQRKIRTAAFVLHYTEETVPLFGCYDLLICCSRHHHDVFRDHPHAVHVPWGTDIGRFHPQGFDPVVKGAVTFFHSGGMNPRRKGTAFVLQAFRALTPGRAIARLVVHAQSELDRRSAELLPSLAGNENLIYIHQDVADLADLYRLGDVAVCPTRHEGLGLTVAEAAACGLAVLVTDAAPMNENADGQAIRGIPVGLRVARSDGDYWPQTIVDAGALGRIMQEYVDNPGRLPAQKRAARDLAEARFDWSKNAQRLRDAIGTCVALGPAKNAAVHAAEEYSARWAANFSFRRAASTFLGIRWPRAASVMRRMRS